MRRFIDEPRAFLAAALINPVERVRTETPAMRRRRRIVVGLTVAFVARRGVRAWYWDGLCTRPLTADERELVCRLVTDR